MSPPPLQFLGSRSGVLELEDFKTVSSFLRDARRRCVKCGKTGGKYASSFPAAPAPTSSLTMAVSCYAAVRDVKHLRANIRHATRSTRHLVHGRKPEDLLAQIAWVEIEEAGDGAFFLFRFSAAGECLADTWHESLDQAKDQARSEFAIEDGDWSEVS